jgi:hypothetical protein
MKKMVVVCLGVLVVWSAATASSPGANPEAFALADRIGEPNARSFFLFATSAGNYTLRQDGMGEFTSPKGLRRVFYLRLGAKGRIERVYFLEHEGDLFLLYEVHDASSEWSYLLRMEQQKRKPRWVTALPIGDIQETIIQGDVVIVQKTEISKTDGRIVRQD